MIWTYLDTRIVLIAGLCAAACVIPGTFLVLKRMGMLTHGLAHAVLPGLVLAFLVAGEANIGVLMIGALLTGIVTAGLVQLLMQLTKIDQGAAIGVVFTSLFAIGLVMMRVLAEKVHLHMDSVIEGQLTLAATEQETYAGLTLPRAAWLLLGVLVLNVLMVILFWKELVASVFDPDHAKLQGLRPHILHQVLMVMTAVTTIAAFEAVGSILVVAMMVVPAATAILICHRLLPIILIAIGLGVGASIAGHVLAVVLPGPLSRLLLGDEAAGQVGDSSSAGMIAVVNGVILLVVASIQQTRRYLRRRRTVAEHTTRRLTAAS